MAVTIKEVAERANVSIASVSYVINNGPRNVSKETRERVEKAILETGYSPNALARSLKTTKTFNIALLISDITDPFFMDLIRGVQKGTVTNGFNLFLCSSQNDIALEKHYIDQLKQQNVDGIIIAGSHLDSESLTQIAHQIKTVILSPNKIPNAFQFYLDDFEGGRLVGDYLLSKGHRKIKYIEGSWLSNDSHRLEGLKASLSESRIDTSELVGAESEVSYEGGFCAAKKILKQYPDTTAIFCYNDLIASGAINACRELGYDVPKDISIIGFDDTYLSKQTYPSLSTVNSNPFEIGVQMTELMISVINGTVTVPDLRKLPLSFVERGSSYAVI